MKEYIPLITGIILIAIFLNEFITRYRKQVGSISKEKAKELISKYDYKIEEKEVNDNQDYWNKKMIII